MKYYSFKALLSSVRTIQIKIELFVENDQKN